MGSNSSSGGGGGGNNTIKQQKKNKFTDLTKENLNPSDDTEAKMDLFYEQGVTNIKNSKFKTPATSLLTVPLQAGSRATRKYFADEVLGKGAYKGTTRKDFEKMSRTKQESMYKTYVNKRTSGKTDAYGRDIISTGDGGGAIASTGQVVQAPKVEAAPTTAELSQATTTAATEDDILTRKRRAKRVGRSPTIMTGVDGVTGGLTLGKKSLLGIS